MPPSAAALVPDADLLRLWSAGDEHAFDELVVRHTQLIYGRCRRALGEVDALDATQAVFLVLTQKRERAAATPVLAAWLMQVASNVVRNALRDRERRRQAERSAPLPQALTEESSMTGFQDHLDACLDELPVAERNAVTLHHLAGLSLAEVATRTDAGVSTVKDRLNRGLERMRKAFLARGLSLTVLLLLSLLAAEAQAAVPPDVFHQIRSTATPRAQRWAKQPKVFITNIAIAASALVLIGGTVSAVLLSSQPTARQTALVPQPASHPAIEPAPAPYLDPEKARAYTVLRWNNGARSAERLRSIPEMALLPPEALNVVEQVASMRQAAVVANFSSIMPAAEGVRQLTLQRDLAQLPPAGRVALMRKEFPRIIHLGSDEKPIATADSPKPWPSLHGWLNFSGAEVPAIQTIRRLLGESTPLRLAPRATSTGWNIDTPNGDCSITIVGGRLAIDVVDEPGVAQVMAFATKPAEGADLACSFVLNPGLPGTALRQTGYMHFTVGKDGLEINSLIDWPTPAQAAEASSAPRLDLKRLSGVPADAFLVAAIPMSPAATRDSVAWAFLFLTLELISSKSQHEDAVIGGEIARACQCIHDLLSHTDGTMVLWAQPGVPMPTLTLEVDASQEAAAALIASSGEPPGADGSITQMIGMVNLAMGWRDGRLICTTVPGGLDAINRAGGLLEQADVRRAVAAMPTRTPELCVLLRPVAFANTVGPYVSMLSPEWMQRMQDYEKRLASDQAYGFLTVHEDQRGVHINATGALSVIAAGILAAQASGQMTLPHFAN